MKKILKILALVLALAMVYDLVRSFIYPESTFRVLSVNVDVWIYRSYKLVLAIILLSYLVVGHKGNTENT